STPPRPRPTTRNTSSTDIVWPATSWTTRDGTRSRLCERSSTTRRAGSSSASRRASSSTSTTASSPTAAPPSRTRGRRARAGAAICSASGIATRGPGTSKVAPPPSPARSLTLGLAVYSGLVLLLAYWVRGMAGFGSGLIAVPLLTLVWPVTVVVPLVVALDYLGSASQGVGNLRQVAWREQLVLIPFMVVGVAVGVWALRTVSTSTLARVLGGFVIPYAVYPLLPGRELRAS